MTLPDLAVKLGKKAKELMEGMNKRTHRNPDIADFAASFAPLLPPKNVNEDGGPIDTDPEPECLRKAQERGDEMFTLVSQDLSSPTVICEWIKQNIETAPEGKLRHALERAMRMRVQPNRKHAD